MKYNLKTDPMQPPGAIGMGGVRISYWHSMWGTRHANSPEEAEAIFRKEIAEVLGFARGRSVGRSSSIVSDAARRLATNDFEVQVTTV